MENLKFEEECNKIIDSVVEKYKYSEDLTNVLRKIVPAMISDATKEEKKLFYNMLMKTPIVVIPKGKGITNKQLQDKYIGNVNPHIEDIEVDLGEYGKGEASGGFVLEPIIDENLQFAGKKQFIHVMEDDISKINTPAKQKMYDTFGTGIEVSHLIHELGHAWAAEKNTYSIDGNVLTERIGTCKIEYEIKDLGDGKYSKREISREGLMIEESLNTNLQEKTIAKSLGISLEEAKGLYKANGIFIPSIYQGVMSDMTEYMTEKIFTDEIKSWRLTGDSQKLNEINNQMSQTKEFEYRSVENEDIINKKQIIKNIPKENVREFFEKYEKDFLPDKTNMTPIQMIENCLLQCYTIKSVQYQLDINTYSDIMSLILKDGYVLINQTSEVLKQKQPEITMKDLVSAAIKENPSKGEIQDVDYKQTIGVNEKENIVLE